MGSNYFSMQFPRLVAANHFSKRLNPESTQMINPKTKKNRVLSILNKNALRPSMSGSFLLFRRRTGEQLHPVFTCFIRPCRTRREEKKRTGCGESAPAVGNEKMTKKKGNKNPETKVNAVSFSNDLSALFFFVPLHNTHTHRSLVLFVFPPNRNEERRKSEKKQQRRNEADNDSNENEKSKEKTARQFEIWMSIPRSSILRRRHRVPTVREREREEKKTNARWPSSTISVPFRGFSVFDSL